MKKLNNMDELNEQLGRQGKKLLKIRVPQKYVDWAEEQEALNFEVLGFSPRLKERYHAILAAAEKRLSNIEYNMDELWSKEQQEVFHDEWWFQSGYIDKEDIDLVARERVANDHEMTPCMRYWGERDY